MKRQIWKGDLQELFDIVRQNVMTMSNVLQEDKAFLSSQREDRMSSSVIGVDRAHARTQKRKTDQSVMFEAQKRKHSEEIIKMNKTVVLESSSSCSSDEQDKVLASYKPKKVPRRRLKPLNPTLTATWDREQLSVRQASSSFIATAISLGHDVSQIAVSPATVHRARAKNRSRMAKVIEDSVFKSPPHHLVLHWDSKLLPIAANIETLEDRVAVVVTGLDFEHLLGVPLTQTGTGAQLARVVIQELNRFGLRNNIIGLSFDTTA